MNLDVLLHIVNLAVLGWVIWRQHCIQQGMLRQLEAMYVNSTVTRDIMNRMVMNQRLFAPIIDKVSNISMKFSDIYSELWESSATRQKVVEAHEAQEAEHAEILRRLEELR